MKALLTTIVLWLTANFELPAADQHPRIELSTPETIAALRHQGSPGNEVVAAYVDRTRTIYLPREWTGGTPGELSVLVHEMVHHLQNMGGMKYHCPQEREKLAFTAQQRWLGMFGSNLFDVFGINEMTLLVRTQCTS